MLWLFLPAYEVHPSMILLGFLIASFLLAVCIVLLGLLKRPQPSEVANRVLLRQIGDRFFFASGLQSSEEMINLLSSSHNIRELPPPSAIIEGDAGVEDNYREIGEAEAKSLVREDNAGVRRNLEREALRITSALVSGEIRRLTQGTASEILPKLGNQSTSEENKS